jgi:hypothetical protein
MALLGRLPEQPGHHRKILLQALAALVLQAEG